MDLLADRSIPSRTYLGTSAFTCKFAFGTHGGQYWNITLENLMLGTYKNTLRGRRFATHRQVKQEAHLWLVVENISVPTVTDTLFCFPRHWCVPYVIYKNISIFILPPRR